MEHLDYPDHLDVLEHLVRLNYQNHWCLTNTGMVVVLFSEIIMFFNCH